MAEQNTDIDWFDVANLLYGDVLLGDTVAIQKQAEVLQQIREDIVCDTIPQITDLASAKQVFGQMLYKVNVLQQRKNQHRTQVNQSKQIPYTYRNANYDYNHYEQQVRQAGENILDAINRLIARYKTLKREVDLLDNRLGSSASIEATNALLTEIFGEPIDELDESSN